MSAQPVIGSPLEVQAAFLPVEQRLIRRTGIELWTLFYWHDDLSDLVADKKLHNITYDPRDITMVYVRGSDGIFRRVPCVTPSIKRMSLHEWRRICASKRSGIRDPQDAALRDVGIEKADEQVAHSRAATKAARHSAHKKAAKEKERQRAVDLIRKVSPGQSNPKQDPPTVNPSRPATVLPVEFLN